MISHAKAATAPSTHREDAKFSLGVIAAMLVCAAAFLGIGAPAAGAATAGTSYIPLSNETFGRYQDPSSVNGVGDIAVSQTTGKIFVAEQQYGTVGIFSPTQAAPGASALTTTSSGIVFAPVNLAVDSTDDSIYLDDPFVVIPSLDRLVSDGQPTPSYTSDPGFLPPGFSSPQGLAVDPSTGDLIVVDSGLVYRLDKSGAEIAAFDGGGTLQSPTAVAVAPDGTIYVVSSGDGSVQIFDPTGTSLGALDLPPGATASTVAVNPVDGRVVVYVTKNGVGSLEGFSSDGSHLFSATLPTSFTDPGTSSTFPTVGHGLAWDANSDRIYLSIGQGLAVTLVSAVQPGVDAPQATSTGYNSAHVTAGIDVGGVNSTAWFEYCSANQNCAAYASSDPTDPRNPWKRGEPISLSGDGEVTIEDDLPLTSNMEWKIRLVAQTDPDEDPNTTDGVSSTSPMISLTTDLIAPVVETGAAASVTTTGARLAGTIDPIGDLTTYHFEYGTTTAYGSRVPLGSEAPAGNNRIPRTVSQPITGLQPGTTYHYRLVATNSAGTTEGEDRTFTTVATGDLPPARAYEQVTPVDKSGAQVRYDFHFQAAADGEAFVPVTRAAASGADSSMLLENYITYRGSDGWSQWKPTDPPLNSATGVFEATTAAVSQDMQHALVISNRELAPGGIEGGGNLYIRDLRDDSYTFVAGNPGTQAFAGLANAKQNVTILLAAAPDFSWIVFNLPRQTLDPDGHTAVYRWSRDEGLTLESVMPDGTPAPQRTQAIASGPQRFTSEDGKVVYFGLEDGGTGGGLYRRENGQTVPVSLSHNPAFDFIPGFAWPVRLAAVSSDGRYAVFTNLLGMPLTPDSPPCCGHSTNAYRYDSHTDELVLLGVRAEFQNGNMVVAVSSDARTVYLTTNDVPGKTRLDVWHDGVVRTISDEVQVDQATASADGRYLAWVEGDGTARLYDRDSEEETCISCTSDGSAAGRAHLRSGEGSISNRLPQAVLDDGTVFFDTPSRLVTADHNGSRDVYEYKDGRVTLISPGTGDYDAVFMDASADGSDVFFATAQGLVGQDVDQQYDVYDARVGGGFGSQSPPPAAASCVRAECSGQVGAVASPPAPGLGSSGPRKSIQDKARLSLGKVRFGSKAVRVGFTASEPGRVTVAGKGVVKSSRKVARSGTYTMTVPLTKKARATIRAHEKFKVSLKVTLRSERGLVSTKYSRTLGK